MGWSRRKSLLPLAVGSVALASIAAVDPAARDAGLPPTGQPIASSEPATTRDGPPALIEARPMGPWGFDENGMDRSVKPGDDFVRYVSGTWLTHTQIPADRSRYGAFDALGELSDLRVRTLLDDLHTTATTLPAEASADAADRVKLAGLYASYLDQAEVDRRDDTPIRPMLASVHAISSLHDMARFMGHSQAIFAGGGTPFYASVSADEKNPQFNTLYISQGGLGLPDREYYLSDQYAEQRAHYEKYVAQMLGMVGWEKPDEAAHAILVFETALAHAQWSRAQNRERERTYNPMTIASLVTSAPDFDWQTFLDAAGVGQAGAIVVSQNTAMPDLARIVAQTSLDTLKAWQAFKVVDEAAPLLSRRFDDAAFAFHGAFMSGAPEQRSREKRAATFCARAMGEAIGREYVAKYFPPEAKAKAQQLVADVTAAMRSRIEHVEWMSATTRAKALAKMDKFGVKIAYPDKWRDYGRLIVDPHDLFGNAVRAERFAYEYRVAKLGQRVDRQEWGMTPQTVNAYYDPSQNEIVFPAAILQPPFFDPNADAAVNYGGIGAVIGHEITHGFDDQGRKSDGEGILNDWWTPDDAKQFEAQAATLGKQYEAFDFPNVPGGHIVAGATMGENIADLGGILTALDAYHLHLHGQAAPVIDGFTGDQRVFLGWAQVWRTLARDAALKQQLATDSHSPGAIRAFAPLRNVDAWYAAFNVQPGDKLYVPPEQRARIW